MWTLAWKGSSCHNQMTLHTRTERVLLITDIDKEAEVQHELQ